MFAWLSWPFRIPGLETAPGCGSKWRRDVLANRTRRWAVGYGRTVVGPCLPALNPPWGADRQQLAAGIQVAGPPKVYRLIPLVSPFLSIAHPRSRDFAQVAKPTFPLSHWSEAVSMTHSRARGQTSFQSLDEPTASVPPTDRGTQTQLRGPGILMSGHPSAVSPAE